MSGMVAAAQGCGRCGWSCTGCRGCRLPMSLGSRHASQQPDYDELPAHLHPVNLGHKYRRLGMALGERLAWDLSRIGLPHGSGNCQLTWFESEDGNNPGLALRACRLSTQTDGTPTSNSSLLRFRAAPSVCRRLLDPRAGSCAAGFSRGGLWRAFRGEVLALDGVGGFTYEHQRRL